MTFDFCAGKKPDDAVGQILPVSFFQKDCLMMLGKNACLEEEPNNGAQGKVVALLYDEGHGPPELPIATVVDVRNYKGPAWIPEHPTWIPFAPMLGECSKRRCKRLGSPVMPAAHIVTHKAQGMGIGKKHPTKTCCIALATP